METAIAGHLIAFRSDRLGARINVIVNAMRLAKTYDVPFLFHWVIAREDVETADINEVTDLLAEDFVTQHSIDRDAWHEAKTDAKQIGKVRSSQDLKDWLNAGNNLIIDNAFGVVCFEDENADDVARAYQDAFDRLPFSKQMNDLCQQVDQYVQNATAYHIRRGDLTSGWHTKHSAWPNKCVPDEFYQYHMNSEVKRDANILIFSDDIQTIKDFQRAKPQLISIDDVVDLSKHSQGVRDFFELYTMSRCKKIIAPTQSAFSTAAACLGGSEKVDVIEDLNHQDRDKAYRALFKRLDNAPDSFTNEGEIGQMLVHLDEWALQNHEVTAVRDLQDHYVSNGLDLAFLYPTLMQNQALTGDYEGVLRTGERMARSPMLNRRSFSEAHCLRALAALQLGHHDDAVTYLSNASTNNSRSPMPIMIGLIAVQTGFLNAQNFLPLPEELRVLASRAWANQTVYLQWAAGLMGLPEDAKRVGGMDVIQSDWSFLTLENREKAVLRDRTALKWAQAASRIGTPDADAFVAYYRFASDGHKGEASDLMKLTEAHPDRPYVLFQASRGAFHSRKRQLAFELAKRAVNLAPDQPGYAAWAGYVASSIHANEESLALLASASERLPGLAMLHYRLAWQYMRMGMGKEAAQAAEKSYELYTGWSGAVEMRAKALVSIDRHQDALELLEKAESEFVLGHQTLLLHADILMQLDRSAEAKKVAERALQLFPDKLDASKIPALSA